MTKRPTELLQEEAIRDVIREVMSAFVGLTMQPSTSRTIEGATWSATVDVKGPFSGSVVIVASERFAFRAASTIFGSAATLDNARDALGEIANVIGGNLKSQLALAIGQHCGLSLPRVSDAVALPDGAAIYDVWSDCEGDLVHVAVVSGSGVSSERQG